jgi:hypothetical protein
VYHPKPHLFSANRVWHIHLGAPANAMARDKKLNNLFCINFFEWHGKCLVVGVNDKFRIVLFDGIHATVATSEWSKPCRGFLNEEKYP